MPVPLRVTFCGEEGSESLMLTAAVREPVAAGKNVTLIVQLVPPANAVPHVFVCGKSLEFVPLIVMLVIETDAAPRFVTVIV